MKSILKFAFISLFIVLYSCTETIYPDFSWSPENPKAGQTVTFSNLTTGGSDWNWYFGDEKVSLLKNPTHIYTKPGIYTIKLRADSNDNFIKTKEIIIYDTVPSIYADADQINYYESVDFSALVYNPYAYDVTYKWTFSSNAVGDSIKNGVCTADEFSLYFKERNVDEIVKLDITVGDSSYSVVDTFFVHDIPARSLLIAQKNGTILRQRLFDLGLEPYTNTGISSGNSPFNIDTKGDEVYIFDAGNYPGKELTGGSSVEGSIKAVNLTNANSRTIVYNNTTSFYSFYSGCISGNSLYWTDFSNYIYKTTTNADLGEFEYKGYENQTSVPYYLARYNRIGYFGNGIANGEMTGGFKVYDDVYFWSKCDNGKGLYRFVNSDIKDQDILTQGVNPESGAILTDYAIRSFAVDPINQMIYFAVTAPSDKAGLWVAKINGTMPIRIDNAPVDDVRAFITDIEVDNVSNYVYWAYRSPELLGEASPSGTWAEYYAAHPLHKTGIKRTKLVKSFSPLFNVEYFAPGIAAYGIAIDNVERY